KRGYQLTEQRKEFEKKLEELEKHSVLDNDHVQYEIEKIVEQFEIIGLIDSNSQKSEAIKFAASKTQN
ncbi:9619_t:CDS:2, partial [Entrophospora sp. SA101]